MIEGASEQFPFTHNPDLPITAQPRAASIVSTKLYPPRLRSNFVQRPHLISLLSEDPDHRITIVTAPAGYGKSTLVAQWLAHLALPAAWVSLEPNDDNPSSFFGLIVSALRSIDYEIASATERLLLTSQEPLPAEAIDRQLIADLSAVTRSFVLVLDDFQVIENPEIHLAMNRILHRLPLSMHLVLISRKQPSLHLARLQAIGELLELGMADLMFGPGETLSYFQECLRLDLAVSEIQLLQARTEGWVAGLHLAGVALRGQPRQRMERFFEDLLGNTQIGSAYLWEEVLLRQSEEVRSFLQRTSVLDRFTADLCDAVTGAGQGKRMIAQCEREGLFLVPLDDSGIWYRYHHLFADVLRERLSQTATDDELDELHRRASQWLEEHELREDATRHAIAGHVWDRAVPLLEELGESLFERDDIVSLRFWLEGLPLHVLERSPILAFWLAWALGRSGRWSDAARPLRIAESAWAASDDRHAQGSLLLWHAARALYVMDNRRAVDLANQALDMLPGDRIFERVMTLMTRAIAYLYQGQPLKSEQTFADVRMAVDLTRMPWLNGFEMTYSSHVLAQRGMLQEAAVLSRRVNRELGDVPSNFWVQASLYKLGEIYYEWGMISDAQRCLQQASELGESTRALQWRSRVTVGLARVAWAEGQTEEAFDLIERAADFASALGTHQLMRNVRACQARLWLASNQVGLARRWAESCELDPYLPPEYERQVEHLTYARLLIREQRPDLALKILNRVDDRAKETGRHGERVEILTLIALAHRAGDNSADAILALQEALRLGEPNGYLRSFVDEGEPLAILMRHAATRGAHRDYAQRILAQIEGSTIPESTSQSGVVEALSEREIEVLRLVGAGLSNREIGQRLFISEKTVKKHLSNIMGKLQAASRTQAIVQGQRLGLL